jgi:hypothetical protein
VGERGLLERSQRDSPNSREWVSIALARAAEQPSRPSFMNSSNPKVEENAAKTAKAKPVILLLEEYEDLLDELQDLATFARRKNESTISVSEVRKRMNKVAALRR